MGFVKGVGKVNWFPGHMASAIRDRLKLTDFAIEVRDARIPFSSKNDELQLLLAGLANPNIMHKWVRYFHSVKQDCLTINAHSRRSVQKPTCLVLVVGVPNVGKSAFSNSIHQIAVSRFPVQEKRKQATVGPLPGVTQDIAGFKIAHQPSIYVLDTPGVLVPSIQILKRG